MSFFSPKRLFILIIALCSLEFSHGSAAVDDYLRARVGVIEAEEAASFGANIKLDKHEIAANECLMSVKQKELDIGHKNTSRFWPANDFVVVRPNIERTESFKILRRMPKGALVHTHHLKLVPIEWVFENLTRLPNLYVCWKNNAVKFKFFETPDKTCKWRLMKDLREREPQTVANIKEFLTLPKASSPGYGVDLVFTKQDVLIAAFDGILLYRPAYEKYIYHALQELYDDNIIHVEFNSYPQNLYELNGTVHDPAVPVVILKRVVDKFVATHPNFLGARYVFGANKQLSREEFGKQIDLYRRVKRLLPEFVIGFDALNYEDRSRTTLYYIEQLLELKNTTFYLHGGESLWNGYLADENLLDAILLNPKRISHAIVLPRHPILLKLIKEKDIAIEVNSISSQLGFYPDLRTHPASHFFANNLAVVLGNDLAGYWNAYGLSYDFYEVFIGIMSSKADLRSLKQLAINSIKYSGMTAAQKKEAFKLWESMWKKFVKHLAYEHKCGRVD